MVYAEILAQAKKNMKSCCACPICDGRACGSTIPGPGAKGSGDGARRNYNAWRDIRIAMDTIGSNEPLSTETNLFGRRFALPLFAGPVGAVQMHYGDYLDEATYDQILVRACNRAGIAAYTGDGANAQIMEAGLSAIAAENGIGIPTIKPWDMQTVEQKIDQANNAGAFAIAMDIDAAGLPFLRGNASSAGRKSPEELARIVRMSHVPFIVKGIMTPAAAMKVRDAGAAGIVVSNHGGRVLDGCPATAEVLCSIVDAVGNDMTILVDGGIRSGVDIFRALALGADGVLVARPFVTALYGGQEVGVMALAKKFQNELADAMFMCGAHDIAGINRDMIFNA